MADISKEFYQQVAANDFEESTYVPANGEEIELIEYVGNAAYDPNVKVEIFWNTTLLFSTHGDMLRDVQYFITGDGSKVLKIKLTNDSSSSQSIGAAYKGFNK